MKLQSEIYKILLENESNNSSNEFQETLFSSPTFSVPCVPSSSSAHIINSDAFYSSIIYRLNCAYQNCFGIERFNKLLNSDGYDKNQKMKQQLVIPLSPSSSSSLLSLLPSKPASPAALESFGLPLNNRLSLVTSQQQQQQTQQSSLSSPYSKNKKNNKSTTKKLLSIGDCLIQQGPEPSSTIMTSINNQLLIGLPSQRDHLVRISHAISQAWAVLLTGPQSCG